MKCFLPFLFSALLLLPATLCPGSTAEELEGAPPNDPPPAPQITIADAITLGIVEGITEFLPISSTGHLILANRALGLDKEVPSLDSEGNPVWKRKPTEINGAAHPGIPYTFKDAVDDYTIIIQGGAIIAVALLYWKRLFKVALGAMGKSREGFLLGRNLLLSFSPAVVFGLLFEEWIETYLFGPAPVAVALAAGGILMLVVERWRRKSTANPPHSTSDPDLHELSPARALFIGLLQCIAMWPGTSRSMITIVGGYIAGFSPVRAAEYSFLLGLITLTAASAYKFLKSGELMIRVLDPSALLIGCSVACIAAAVSVRWLIHYLTRHGLTLFAYYRFILAAAVLGMIVLFG